MFKIAISGKANSGKNTLTRQIVKQLGFEFQTRHKAFADPIKEAVLKMFPKASREGLFGPSHLRCTAIPGTTLTYRKILCDIGALGRSYDESHWVNNLIDDYLNSCNSPLPPKVYIISDLRFVDEHHALRQHGFYLIRLKRKNISHINDISETNQDLIPDDAFDFVVDNDTTIEYLHGIANEIVKILLANKQD